MEKKLMSATTSVGFEKEMAVHAELKDSYLDLLSGANTLDEYSQLINAGTIVDHVRRVSADWPRGGRVLDVGFGLGFSTMCLVERGFDVVGLEPSAACIEAAQAAAKKFGLPFDAICATAEDIGDTVESTFDVVLFHSCLHHCDDPEGALSSAYRVLRPGGRVVLVEPTLKPWHTKKWFQHQLEVNPVKMGHYGGNEHIYYTSEYQAMLRRASFTGIQWRPRLAYADLRQLLSDKIHTTIDGQYTFSLLDIALRAVFYVGTASIMNSERMSQPLKLLSLIDGVFVGFKKASANPI
jgi:SAM-dependent methyltransferase